jgi:nuclear pore complex protein Nup155
MSRMLPAVLRFHAPDPLKQVLVDEYRCTLYTRSEAGAYTRSLLSST